MDVGASGVGLLLKRTVGVTCHGGLTEILLHRQAELVRSCIVDRLISLIYILANRRFAILTALASTVFKICLLAVSALSQSCVE